MSYYNRYSAMARAPQELFDLKKVLACALCEIAVFGWLPYKKAAEQGEINTSRWVKMHLTQRTSDSVKGRVAAMVEWAQNTGVDLLHGFDDEIDEIIEWVKDPKRTIVSGTIEDTQRMAVERGEVWDTEIGAIAAVIPIYRQWKANQNSTSTWIGTLGEKVDLTGKVIESRDINAGKTGEPLYLLKAETDDGNIVMWWSNAPQVMNINDRVKIHGRIKEHKEFNGLKETRLYYVKVEKI